MEKQSAALMSPQLWMGAEPPAPELLAVDVAPPVPGALVEAAPPALLVEAAPPLAEADEPAAPPVPAGEEPQAAARPRVEREIRARKRDTAGRYHDAPQGVCATLVVAVGSGGARHAGTSLVRCDRSASRTRPTGGG